MGLINNFTEVKWHSKTKQWYLNKGYNFTKMGDTFRVKVEDLTIGSKAIVSCICDCCNKELNITHYDYKRRLKPEDKCYCLKCAHKIFATSNMMNTKLRNSVSFQQWCYDNLSKEKAYEIISRWDYEKNNYSPDEVCYSTNKKYWFKCIKHFHHSSELKNLDGFVHGFGDLECIQCNSIIYTHPDITNYLVNKEDANKYSHGTKEKLLCKCPDCGYEKLMHVKSIIHQGFGCPRCSDGVSYPEKFMLNLLEQLKIKCITQYSKSNAGWCKNYRYDFYLTDYDIIIEVHGGIHYNGWNKNEENLKFQIHNDKAKQDLALNNSISKYIIIDARYSKLDWIKESIISSELNGIFNLSNIDWEQCEHSALSNYIYKVCNLWKSGIKNTNEISEAMNLHITTIVRYLKRGAKIGLCDYNPILSNQRRVICLNTGETFDKLSDTLSQ